MSRQAASSSPITLAASLIPLQPTLAGLQKAAATCQACELWRSATQTVFGDGEVHAEVMLIGEQPGDQEDLAGKPFVGPAGQVLAQALAEVGIDRQKAYVTNVVKHFKWIPKGRLRLHQTPNAQEIAACRPWLDTEIALVKPYVIVCLGATAAQTLLGKQFRVTRQHGEFIASSLAPFVTATLHPASILRIPDPRMRESAHRQFVSDLQKVATQLRSRS
jgi:uracil-DNA glycosylase